MILRLIFADKTLPYFIEELSRTCLSLQDLAVMFLGFIRMKVKPNKLCFYAGFGMMG